MIWNTTNSLPLPPATLHVQHRPPSGLADYFLPSGPPHYLATLQNVICTQTLYTVGINTCQVKLSYHQIPTHLPNMIRVWVVRESAMKCKDTWGTSPADDPN